MIPIPGVSLLQVPIRLLTFALLFNATLIDASQSANEVREAKTMESQLAETGRSWERRRLSEFRKRLCSLETNRLNSEEQIVAFQREIANLRTQFSDQTAKILRVSEFKIEPKTIKLSGTRLMFNFDGKLHVATCTDEDRKLRPNFLDGNPVCSDVKTLPYQIEELLQTAETVFFKAASPKCPRHLVDSDSDSMVTCINPCPEDRPNLRVSRPGSSGDENWLNENCHPCPDNFPIYSDEHLDCVDAAGCTRSEGHYKTSDGKIKCGPDCPRGWKLVVGDYCQEDLNESCARCQEAIHALQSWKVQAPAGEQKQSTSGLRECSHRESDEVFEDFKARVISSLEQKLRACTIQQGTPRLIPRLEMAFVDAMLTPCVNELRFMNPWSELESQAHFMFDCTISNRFITFPDYLLDF